MAKIKVVSKKKMLDTKVVKTKKGTAKKKERPQPRQMTPVEKAMSVLQLTQLNNVIHGSDYLVAMAGFIMMKIFENGINGTIGVNTILNGKKTTVRFTAKDDEVTIQFI